MIANKRANRPRGRLETLIGLSRDVAKGGFSQYEPAIRHGGMRLPRKSIGLSPIGHNRRPAMPRPCHCRVVLPTQLVAQELRDHHDTIGRTSTTEIGRAHVCTPVTNAHLVCRLLLEK